MRQHEKSITIRVPSGLADRIDRFAEARKYERKSEAIRQLLERGLAFGHKILTDEEAEKLFDNAMRAGLRGEQ